MAQNQREINRLRHIIEEKDREIEMLRENENDSGRMDSGITEEFSHRVNELEGMVKGLAEDFGRMEPGITEEFSHRVNDLEGMIKGLAEDFGRMEPGITEEFSHRINDLEGMIKGLTGDSDRIFSGITEKFSRRVNDLEGMVKGLTEELLDLKAEVRKIGKVLEGKEELNARPDIRRARPVPEKMVTRPEQVIKRSEQPPQYVSRPEESELGTATIMQPDGTLAEEPRKSNDLIVAGNRPASMYQPKVNREYRGKEEKKPLIYANEDDTVEIKKK